MSAGWDGLLLIDKPPGPTSHDIVAHVRRSLPGVRIGHTGTLDPPATGLLILMLGGATRLARFLPSAPKCYVGELVLGISTTTDDLDGEVLERYKGPWPGAGDIVAAAGRLVGRHLQVPPTVSAKHIDGRRAYRLAQRGRPVVPKAAEVVVESFSVAPTGQPDRWQYDLVVSTGTYVRACVRDLGTALGSGAAVASLRRVRIGPWRVEDAIAWDAPGFLGAASAGHVTLESLPLGLERVVLEDGEARRRFSSGADSKPPATFPGSASAIAVHAPSGELLGIGSIEASKLRPTVVLAVRQGDGR
jgi:tRNA pseudouridine55 synthase